MKKITLLLLISGMAYGQANLVAHTGFASAANNTFTTSAINITGATLVVIAYNHELDAASTNAQCTDNVGNTFTFLTVHTNQILAYKIGPTTSAAYTITCSNVGNAVFGTLQVQAWNGGTFAFVSSTGSGGAASVCGPGGISTATGDLIVSAVQGSTSSGAITVDAGFTISDQNYEAPDPTNSAMAYFVAPNNAGVTMGFTMPSGGTLGCSIARFSVGGGAVTMVPRKRVGGLGK